MRIVLTIFGLTAALLLAACHAGENGSVGAIGNGNGSKGSAAGKITVVATTTELADFAKVVGGDRVDVHGLVKANVDPHDFEPSPADLKDIANAAVIIENGVGLEKWFAPTIKSAEPEGEIVDSSKGVSLRKDDPHIWHNPQNAKVMVANIVAAFGAADPDHKAEYEQRRDAYDAELDRLDADIKAQIATLTNKKLVTNHDAFGYYVDHFGLEFVGSIIPSFDTQTELSARDVSKIVGLIKATGVKAVFSESALPGKTAEAIGREAGVTVVTGEDAIYGDTLGPPGSDGATYLQMERHNTKEIVDHLR
jgi:zinc/manganese transport system substrate-binding protein/manganese/iron transport system substrate-binding protein